MCALPVERARRLWNRQILAADPHLARMRELTTRGMNGIQFYLRERTPIVRGIVVCLDSPWAIASASQAQFWADRDFARDYGDGQARDDLSAYIADCTEPGVLYGKPATHCTPDEVAREVWEQMKRHLNDTGQAQLSDDLLHSWHLDPGLIRRRDRWINEDVLMISTVGSWNDRPSAATAIPNLFLAADYVQVDFEVASMEAANEAGRRAANAVLAHTASREAPCDVFERHQPEEWELFRKIDDQRYRQRQPNLFDTDLAPTHLRRLLRLPTDRTG